MAVKWPTYAQIFAVGRHVVTAGGAMIGMAGALGWLAPNDAKDALASWNTLGAAIGTLASIVAASYAGASASPQAQIAAVAANPDVKVIVTTPDVAAAAPSNKVQSQ